MQSSVGPVLAVHSSNGPFMINVCIHCSISTVMNHQYPMKFHFKYSNKFVVHVDQLVRFDLMKKKIRLYLLIAIVLFSFYRRIDGIIKNLLFPWDDRFLFVNKVRKWWWNLICPNFLSRSLTSTLSSSCSTLFLVTIKFRWAQSIVINEKKERNETLSRKTYVEQWSTMNSMII